MYTAYGNTHDFCNLRICFISPMKMITAYLLILPTSTNLGVFPICLVTVLLFLPTLIEICLLSSMVWHLFLIQIKPIPNIKSLENFCFLSTKRYWPLLSHQYPYINNYFILTDNFSGNPISRKLSRLCIIQQYHCIF